MQQLDDQLKDRSNELTEKLKNTETSHAEKVDNLNSAQIENEKKLEEKIRQLKIDHLKEMESEVEKRRNINDQNTKEKKNLESSNSDYI